MIVEVGKKYKTRGGMVATITQDIRDWSPLYSMQGFVLDTNGNIIQPLCMWTMPGNYIVGHESTFDLLNIIEE